MKIVVKMTARDLFDFSMYNSYSGFTGLFNIVFTAGAVAILAVTWNWPTVSVYQRILLVLCALMFTVVQPVLLMQKSKKQAASTGFSLPITLTLSDEKFAVEQGGVTGDMEWGQIWKVICIKSLYIIKVGPVRAYLIPKRSVEGREKELESILKKNLPVGKMKGLKA